MTEYTRTHKIARGATQAALALWLIFTLCVPPAAADVVYLKNGRKMEGIIVEEKEDGLQLEVGFGKVGIRRADIIRIEKAGAEQKAELQEKWELRRVESERKRKEAAEKEATRPKEIALTKDGGGLVLDALLNDNVAVRLILDTGASFTVITNRVAEKLGINVSAINEKVELTVGNGQKTPAKVARLQSIRLGDAEAVNVPVAILDPSITEPSLKDGLLGMTFLQHFSFKVDQKKNTLVLESN